MKNGKWCGVCIFKGVANMGCGIMSMAMSLAGGHYWWQHWIRTGWVEDLSLHHGRCLLHLHDELTGWECWILLLAISLASSTLKQPLSLLGHILRKWNRSEYISYSCMLTLLLLWQEFGCMFEIYIDVIPQSLGPQRLPSVVPGCEVWDQHCWKPWKVLYLI